MRRAAEREEVSDCDGPGVFPEGGSPTGVSFAVSEGKGVFLWAKIA